MSNVTIHVGSNLDVLPTLAENSIDSIVTDPPYELGFMGKAWDASGIAYNVELWRQCLRVLKPGGHLLAFSGSRTYHRMTCAIEDAGFEVRDQIMWVYGSGFPKSLDVSKAIDKRGGVSADFTLFRDAVKEAMVKNKVSRAQLQSAIGNFMLSHYLSNGSQPAIPNLKDYLIIRDTLKLGNKFDRFFSNEANRTVIGHRIATLGTGESFAILGSERKGDKNKKIEITSPSTDAAKQWDGWGTALKPAHEPICVARKPLNGTVADNVMKWGTGAINVDGCRVGTETVSTHHAPKGTFAGGYAGRGSDTSTYNEHQGRWPANLIHDGSDEVLQLFPESNGGAAPKKANDISTLYEGGWKGINRDERIEFGKGSAARFFYCAKASKRDRDEGCDELETKEKPAHMRTANGVGEASMESGFQPTQRKNTHPTVKPTELMRYLCRLVTPPGGTVLDPFMGSGSTGRGAILEGFAFTGIELSDEYAVIARARIDAALKSRQTPT